MNQNDLGRPEQALADGQRAQLFLRDEAAGVADHMGVALMQSEQALDVQPCVQAGDDRHPLGRRKREARTAART